MVKNEARSFQAVGIDVVEIALVSNAEVGLSNMFKALFEVEGNCR